MTKNLPLNKVIPLMLLYCIITIIGMFHHELWYDEVQHFLIARDSTSFSQMMQSNSFDDHVQLWKILLYFLTHFISNDPLSIQVLHLIIINIAVFIFLRFAPFDLMAKILILLGYYFIFEYSILCRNYAIGILFLFTVCVLLSRPDKNILMIGFLLLLMSNTHVFFFAAAIGIFLYLLAYYYERKSFNIRFLAFTIVCFLGLVIVAAQLLHTQSYNSIYRFNKWWLTVHNLSFAVHGLDKGFIPFPPLHDPNFWNRYLFQSWSSFVKVPISLLCLTFPVWVIRKSRKALIFYITSSFLLLMFLTMSQMTGSRYFGMFFIYFIAAIWLTEYEGVNVLRVNKNANQPPVNIVAIGIFYTILFTQSLAGAYIYEQDYTRPFSQGKNTVKFMREQHLDNLPLVVDGYNAGPALSTYFGHPFYYLDLDATGSYCWDINTLMHIKPLDQEFRESKYLPTLNEFILISDRKGSDSLLEKIPGFHFNKINSFQGAIIPVENYNIYKATRK